MCVCVKFEGAYTSAIFTADKSVNSSWVKTGKYGSTQQHQKQWQLSIRRYFWKGCDQSFLKTSEISQSFIPCCWTEQNWVGYEWDELEGVRQTRACLNISPLAFQEFPNDHTHSLQAELNEHRSKITDFLCGEKKFERRRKFKSLSLPHVTSRFGFFATSTGTRE